MSKFLHKKLPDFSTILSGHTPRDTYGFQSNQLQILYNNTDEAWCDPGLHYHAESDECFIVLKGSIVVQVQDEVYTINAGEYCCFPIGMWHAVIETHPPVESLMIRAPSVADKVYEEGADAQQTRFSVTK